MNIFGKKKRKTESTCAIVIPIYQETINKYEALSLRQCFVILRNYPIYLVTHSELNIEEYKKTAKEHNIELRTKFFNSKYFENIDGYNALMKSVEFYSSFASYTYILIYQLDAYVFRDELKLWCKHGYDYIGAPWFDNYGDKTEDNNLWAVGNGGLSLRRVEFFLKVLKWKLPLKKIKIHYRPSLLELKKIAYTLGWHNNIKYYLREKTKMNEDGFFTVFLFDAWISPNLPSVEKALEFSFEKSPAYLYERNGNRLPFGCHAFRKYDYDFWKEYIHESGAENA